MRMVFRSVVAVSVLGAGTQPAATIAQTLAPHAIAAPKPKPALRFDPVAFDSYVKQAQAHWGVPGLAVAVVRGDQVLMLNRYGVRQLGKPQRVDRRTLFNIGSVTKSFTAAMLGSLAAE